MSTRCAALRRAAAQTRSWTSSSLTTCSVLQASRRWQSTSTSDRARPRTRRVGLGTLAFTGLGALSSSAYFYLRQPTQTPDVDDTNRMHGQQTPLTDLIRTYTVYSMCSIPWLVDYSPSILSFLFSVPGLKYVTEAIVRATFFSQFVGGESASDTFPVLTQLRAENKGAILNYSAEVDERETVNSKGPAYKQHVEEIIRCIDAAADFEDQRQLESGTRTGRKTWVAVKLTALVPGAETFINFSKYLIKTRPPASRFVTFPGIPRPSDLDILRSDPIDLPETCPITKEDMLSLRELRDDLFKICQRAKERGVAIAIDAEHSWYQPAIEAFQFALMREFNRLSSKDRRGQPSHALVYGTFQAYLRRTPEQLEQALQDAEEGNFALGVKLVRGAYHQLETSTHAQGKRRVSGSDGPPSASSLSISTDDLPPVWQTKAETDTCFDTCARMLITRVAEDIRKERDSKGGYKRVPPVPKLGLLFGTHNAASCDLVLDALVDEGLAVPGRELDENGQAVDIIRIGEDVAQRVAIGQLYGMCDALSTSLAQRVRTSSSSPGEPFVLKYIPYGPLPLVMPYLSRRAIENRSVLEEGGTREERKGARREIWKRVKVWFGLV